MSKVDKILERSKTVDDAFVVIEDLEGLPMKEPIDWEGFVGDSSLEIHEYRPLVTGSSVSRSNP